jgi:hypothetical protein
MNSSIVTGFPETFQMLIGTFSKRVVIFYSLLIKLEHSISVSHSPTNCWGQSCSGPGLGTPANGKAQHDRLVPMSVDILKWWLVCSYFVLLVMGVVSRNYTTNEPSILRTLRRSFFRRDFN